MVPGVHDRCALVGMVHLLPLPGSPRWGGDRAAVSDAAVRDAEALLEGGCDALIVENMGDVPYLRGEVPPWTVAAMALATERVVQRAGSVPVGVQVLAAANREALGVAVACGARFLRVEGFAFAHVADEGWIDACAGQLLRARKALGATLPGKVRINSAGCLDRCEQGPVLVVYPEAVWYTYVDRDDIDEIVEEHLVNGRVVERLRV